jgi:hypothetical protein
MVKNVSEQGAEKNIWTWREEITGWRKLHNEGLHNLYSAPNYVRITKSRMRWAGHVSRMGNIRNTCKIVAGKSEGNKTLGRPR